MNDNTLELLDKKTLMTIQHEIKICTSELSKSQLEETINIFLDQVLADPGNPILRAKAKFAADVWNGRY